MDAVVCVSVSSLRFKNSALWARGTMDRETFEAIRAKQDAQ